VITRGQVDVWRTCRGGQPEPAGRLAAGQYFSALELPEAEPCGLSFRAAPGETVEVLALGLESFHTWLAENPAAGQALRQEAAAHRHAYCPPPARGPGAAGVP
jgi:CRP-like cAMP-binding protein